MRQAALTLGCLTAFLLPNVAAHAAIDVTAGKRLYVDNCRRCHGAVGQGGIGKKLAGDAAYWDFDVFERTVLTGIDDEGHEMKTEMPRWGTTGFAEPAGVKPSDDDLKNIQAYLRTFGRKHKSTNRALRRCPLVTAIRREGRAGVRRRLRRDPDVDGEAAIHARTC